MNEAVVPEEMLSKLTAMLNALLSEKLEAFVESIAGFKQEHDAWKGKGSPGREAGEMGVMIPVIYLGIVSEQLANLLAGGSPAPPEFIEKLTDEVKLGLEDSVSVLNEAVVHGKEHDLAKTEFIQSAALFLGKMLTDVAAEKET
jgi:hypothetical protein